MSIKIREVLSKSDLKKFINLPQEIHKNHTNWVPPIYMDEREFFNPKKNKAFSFSDTILLLAYKDNKLVGRIMGVINKKYNKDHHLSDGRFCFLETYNDFEVANELIVAVEKWAYEKGMTKLVGPLAFSDKDPQGMLVEGFDEPHVIATNCNFEYMVDFMDKAEFNKKIDLVVYKINVPEKIPEFYSKVSERALRNNPELSIAKIKTKLQIKPYIKPVFRLVNETFKDIYAFTPMTEKEMNGLAARYLPVLSPRFIKVIENDKKEVIAFVLAMPDIGAGVKKAKGRVIPFGIFHIIRSQKKTRQLDLLLGAIHPNYRNCGLDAVLATELIKEAHMAKIEYLDSHLELETNLKMRAENEKLGGKVYKRYRIFEKDLTSKNFTDPTCLK